MGTFLPAFWRADHRRMEGYGGKPSVSLCSYLAAALLAIMTGACAAHGVPYPRPPVHAGIVHVDVVDRVERSTLPVYAKDGRRYIVGTPGHEYALRIRNRTGARVLVVTSVDGVNVISGDTASPAQSGYVLDPWGSVEIIGWRKSLNRTAAFFFTEHQNSYAARTGRPNDVGVIGVAVFQEKVQPIARDHHFQRGQVASEAEAPAPGASARAETRSNEAPSSAGGIRGLEDSARQSPSELARSQGRLGTGHGRSETSRVRMVNFERASETPTETVAIQYDRRENLAALGVLPAPIPLTRRDPDPFPGVRFAPDPGRPY